MYGNVSKYCMLITQPTTMLRLPDVQAYITHIRSVRSLNHSVMTTLPSANLEPSTKDSNNTANGSADRLNGPVTAMDRVLTPLTRCAVNERTCGTEAGKIALNFLERRAVLGRKVVPHAAVVGIQRVLDLVDFAISWVVRNLDCVCVSTEN
jgi:hypothetical protein